MILVKILGLVILCHMCEVAADLSDRLLNYELLHHTDIIGTSSGKEKRDTTGQTGKSSAIVELTVPVMDRTFELLLTEDKALYGKDFSIMIVKDNGVEEPAPFSTHVFYKGIVLGEAHSEVFLHWDGENVINAKIVTTTDTYFIEPSSRHLPKSANYSMIAYKASDLLTDSSQKHGSYCGGAKHFPRKPAEESVKYSTDNQHANPFTVPLNEERQKRQASSPLKNTCGLLVVIDYRFLSEIMGEDTARASNYVVDLIARVNSIYRETTFGTHKGFGFQIEQIKIHDQPSSDPDHYNYGERTTDTVAESEPNPVNVLLDAFGRVDKTGNSDYTQFCLAHLFTAYAFENGVLGLAYIASQSKNTFGGICSRSFYDTTISSQVYLNTGWSSAFNRKGEKILTQEAEIVLAHELGHNWGSEHDPDTRACTPSDGPASDGKFIMYTYSVSGFKPNNKKFSSCTTVSIGQVLTSKSDFCFKEMSSPTRGNFRRDGDEQCDAGLQGDRCCNSEQKFTPGSDCSITNDVCCKDCTIRQSAQQLCATASTLTCVADTKCTGRNSTCPLNYKPAGDYCQKKEGRCVQDKDKPSKRVCLPFADVLGLSQCPCPKEEDECKLCHKPGTVDPPCQIFDPNTLDEYFTPCGGDEHPGMVCSTLNGNPMYQYELGELPKRKDYIILEDSSCKGGYCDADAECVRQSTDLVARFWDFLNDLTINGVVEFMRSNIVGTVAVFSFILWLPCVIVIYCYDRKQAKKAKLEEQAFKSMRRQVDDRRIVSRPQLH